MNNKQPKVGTPKQMQDGTEAYLSQSKKHFIRREPDEHEWNTIKYYTLEGESIQLAKATCGTCDDVIESQCCGDFVTCKCGDSSVDTDRWFPERHRYIGNNIKHD
jgi:hypothetical protein